MNPQALLSRLKAAVEPSDDPSSFEAGWPTFKRAKRSNRQTIAIPSETQRQIHLVATTAMAEQRKAKAEQSMKEPGKVPEPPKQSVPLQAKTRRSEIAPTKAPKPDRNAWGQQARPSIHGKK